MDFLKNNKTNKIVLNLDSNFKIDLGKEENLEIFEEETIEKIINPIENYETSRFMHNPYSGLTVNGYDLMCDIWYYFYFLNDAILQTHENGLDYSYVGITHNENARLLKQSVKSFFKLDFYKTIDNELPTHMNRKLVFSRNLSLPSGEKFFYEPFGADIFVPVFTGSKFKNRENMYLFWFYDDSVLEETYLTGNTFYMTARFFNSDDGSIINFGNKSISVDGKIDESFDLYYLVELDKTNLTYNIYNFNGVKGNRIGYDNNPIKFYELVGG